MLVAVDAVWLAEGSLVNGVLMPTMEDDNISPEIECELGDAEVCEILL